MRKILRTTPYRVSKNALFIARILRYSSSFSLQPRGTAHELSMSFLISTIRLLFGWWPLVWQEKWFWREKPVFLSFPNQWVFVVRVLEDASYMSIGNPLKTWCFTSLYLLVFVLCGGGVLVARGRGRNLLRKKGCIYGYIMDVFWKHSW